MSTITCGSVNVEAVVAEMACAPRGTERRWDFTLPNHTKPRHVRQRAARISTAFRKAAAEQGADHLLAVRVEHFTKVVVTRV